jgi:hypothetical protein
MKRMSPGRKVMSCSRMICLRWPKGMGVEVKAWMGMELRDAQEA